MVTRWYLVKSEEPRFPKEASPTCISENDVPDAFRILTKTPFDSFLQAVNVAHNNAMMIYLFIDANFFPDNAAGYYVASLAITFYFLATSHAVDVACTNQRLANNSPQNKKAALK